MTTYERRFYILCAAIAAMSLNHMAFPSRSIWASRLLLIVVGINAIVATMAARRASEPTP